MTEAVTVAVAVGVVVDVALAVTPVRAIINIL